MHILVDYPKNNKIKFLFTSYPTQELTGRDRVVKEQLRLPNETKSDVFIVVETDLTDLTESLQTILKKSLKADDSDIIAYRVFFDSGSRILNSEGNMDIYNLVYAETDWSPKSKNTKAN